MELALLLALSLAAGWGIVAKGERTLRATRGGAGAVRGVGRYARGKGRAPAKKARTPATKTAGGRKGRTGSTAQKADTRPQPTSIVEAARMGWADGVQRALDRRAAGRDIVGRTRRATRWTADRAGRVHTGLSGLANVRPRVRRARAERKARLEAAKAIAAKTAETQDPPAPAEGNTQDSKEKDMATTNLAVGEMATLGDMQADTKKLSAAAAAHQETEAALKAAAATFAERYKGADWGTEQINTAAAGVTDSASGPGLNTEALIESLSATEAALNQAQQVGEVAASVKATGRVENFAS